MGPLVVAIGWMMIAGAVFVPVFAITLVMLRSFGRAFVLAAVFTIGVFAGAILAFLIPVALARVFEWDVMRPGQPEWMTRSLMSLYFAAAAIVGGLVAALVLGRLSKYPPWRRY
jgi:hypothetical protein